MKKIFKPYSLVGFFALMPLLFISAPQVVAEDDFAKGCQLYTAKNYPQAESALNETVRRYPKFWPGHYYLAHTLLALGKRTAARKEYEACLTSVPAPGADVTSACQKVIVSLGGTPPEPASAAESAAPPSDGKTADGKGTETKSADAKTASSDTGEKKDEPETLREKEKRLHIERLRKMCSDKIASIREDLKQALAEAEKQSNKWVRAEDGDTRKIVIPDDVEAEIQKEYQDRITRVQEATEREIAGIH